MSKRGRGKNIIDEESENQSKKTKPSSTTTGGGGDGYVHEEDFDDGYDDDLKGDEADRRYLESLGDVECEEILNERYERRIELRRKKEKLRKQGLLIERGRKPPSSSSSSKTAAVQQNDQVDLSLDEEDDEPVVRKKKASGTARRTRRSKPLSSSDDEDYEDDDQQQQQPVQSSSSSSTRLGRQQQSSLRDESDEEDQNIFGEGSDNEEESSKCKITKKELERVLIRRSALEKEFKEPYFASSIEKAFVRVLVGFNERAKKKTYRLCQIIQVQDMTKDYLFGPNNSERTKKGLLLKFGVQKRTWQMSAISDNKEIEENEYKAWKAEMEKVNEKFPTKKFIEEKIQKWKSLKEFRYTDEQIESMLQERRHQKGGLIVKNKQSIAREISAVKTKIKLVDDELYLRAHQNKVQTQFSEFDEDDGRSEIQSESSLKQERQKWEEELKKLEKEYSKIDFLSPTAQRLGFINNKNRAMDQAAHEQRKKNQHTTGNTNQNSTGQLDPFSRRKTASSFFVLADTEEATTKEASSTQTSSSKQQSETRKISSATPENSLVSAHDFQLDLHDAGAQPIMPSLRKMKPSTASNKKSSNKKRITLAEYKRLKSQ